MFIWSSISALVNVHAAKCAGLGKHKVARTRNVNVDTSGLIVILVLLDVFCQLVQSG